MYCAIITRFYQQRPLHPPRFPIPRLNVTSASVLWTLFCLAIWLCCVSPSAINMDLRRPLMYQSVRCINCNIRVDTCNAVSQYRVLELDTRVISIISTWVDPVLITEEDYICEACLNLARHSVNVQLARDNICDPDACQSQRGHSRVCLLCGRSLNHRQSHLILAENSSDHHLAIIQIIRNRIAPREMMPSDRVCHACWLHASREATRHQNMDDRRPVNVVPDEDHSDVEPSEAEPELMNSPRPDPPSRQQQQHESNSMRLPNYKRAANTASHCMFAGCDNLNVHTVSDSLRKTIFQNHKYYVPVLARICTEHLQRNSYDTLFDAPNSLDTFTAEQVEHIFSFFMTPFSPFLDFSSVESINQIDDHLFGYWMGLTKDQFLNLLSDLPRVSETHRGMLGLASILIKMRTGDSDDRLSTLLKVPRTTLERLMGKVRNILLQDFVPRNLGINHVTRAELLQHNLSIPNGIYNNNNRQVIIICDGTYIFLNKSTNFMFQKETYSLHKYRNLLKPFIMVACDGYIVDVFGPYKATTSDAEIMTSLFHDENSSLRAYFQSNDVFILDRGFRDSISLLQHCGYRAYMPESLLEGEQQLTTAQANRNRCITICRWVVEVVNGYFKRDYRLFRFDYFNKTVPHMLKYFKIAASLINKFGVRLRNRADADQILTVLRERMPLENNLSRIVNELNINRRASLFRSITADSEFMFPRLELNDLILFALGTYQIRLARSYYGEHVRSQGEFIIEVSREPFEQNLRGNGENSLIRGRIKSRHISRRIYYVYILIQNNVNGREGILEYCCSCLVGRRTVGCCAHLMSVVWYLGWARHQASIAPPAAFLDDVVIRDME